MLNRRQFAGAMAATIGFAASAQAQPRHGESLYFVPGGRIGFRPVAGLKPHANQWQLFTPDQTFDVFVTESLRVNREWDANIWEQDRRHTIVTTKRLPPNFEHRHFRDQRHGDSIDFGSEVHAFRDETWLGQIRLSTKRLGPVEPSKVDAPGQIARWRDVMAEVAASVTIRPPLTVAETLKEFRIGLDTDGLNPRFAGDSLTLSVRPPKNPRELVNSDLPHIWMSKLAIWPMGNLADYEQANNDAFEKLRDHPGSRVVQNASCRVVVRAESAPIPPGAPLFTTYADAFGRTRSLLLSASYEAKDRGPILAALDRVLASLSLPDIV